jgi:hypothetical protein
LNKSEEWISEIGQREGRVNGVNYVWMIIFNKMENAVNKRIEGVTNGCHLYVDPFVF